MLHFQRGTPDPRDFWHVAAASFADATGTDLFIGRNAFGLLVQEFLFGRLTSRGDPPSGPGRWASPPAQRAMALKAVPGQPPVTTPRMSIASQVNLRQCPRCRS